MSRKGVLIRGFGILACSVGLLALAACPRQANDSSPCPEFTTPGPLATGTTTWTLSDGVGVDETLEDDSASCAARLSVNKVGADFDPEPAQGDMPGLWFDVIVSCPLAPTQRDAFIGFDVLEDLRFLSAGDTLTLAVVPSLDYGPAEGQVCRWNELPVYSSAEPPPEGDLVVEVLDRSGGPAAYPDFVTDDFSLRVKLTYTAPDDLIGYQQIDGAQEPCPRWLEELSFDLVFELQPEMFSYDTERVCFHGG